MRFETFVQLLDVLAERGLPTLLQEEYFRDRPAPDSSQFIAALRFFDLIDAQGQPLPRLILLIDDVARRRILQQLISTHYVRPLRIGIDATPAGIEAWFQEQGLEETEPRRRAITFLVNAADYAGMRLPGVTDDQARAELGVEEPAPAEQGEDMGQPQEVEEPAPPRATADEGGARRSLPDRQTHGDLESLASAPPAEDQLLPEHTLEAKRSAYIDLLMDLVKASGDHPDEKLLDRIERVLAYPQDDADESREPEPAPAEPPAPRPAQPAQPATRTTKKRAPRAKR